MIDPKKLEKLVKKKITDSSISCSTMVVTFFGDLASQHGGWIWLGSLIDALAPMGYSERLVRTAVYRLMQSDWLQVKRIGRRSYYCFTDTARGHYEKAARRIYAGEQPAWDGSWILVAPALVADDKKEEFRKSLLWQGFNALVTGMYAHPSSDTTSLDETIYEQRLLGDVVVLKAKTTDVQSQEAIKRLVKNRWNFDELEAFYSEFIEFYRQFTSAEFLQGLTGREMLLIRLLLIHEYRRILLRDPDFPDPMLPQGWVGRDAQILAKKIYTLLSRQSIEYICDTLESARGHLSEPSSAYYKRFGGLPKS